MSVNRSSLDIELLEYTSAGLAHGVLLKVYDDRVEVYGIGRGIASYLNMYQSGGRWLWGYIDAHALRREMKVEFDCEDLAKIVAHVIEHLKEPAIAEFVSRFVEAYPMHGRKICRSIEIEKV